MANLINGRQHDWVSLKMTLPAQGKRPVGFKSVTYPDHGQAKTNQYGSGKNPVGYTRGAYEVNDLEVEFFAAAWDEIRTAIGPGYGEVAIPLVLAYADIGMPTRTDVFEDCHVIKEQPVVAQGTDAATVKVTFKPSRMVLGGIPFTLPTAA